MKSALAKWVSSSRCGENHRYRARNRSRRSRRGGRRRSCAGHLERQADGVPRAAPSQLPTVLRRPADLADRHLDADGRAIVAGAEALEFAVDARHRLVRGLHADRAGRAVRGRGGRSRRSPALIIGAQTLLMISAFVLGILTWAGVVKVEYVIVLAALNGFVSSFDMPGRQAFVVEMVGREDLPNAIAMNSMIFNGARMIGPAIAGLSIAVIGVTGCFMLNGVSYLAVLWSLFQMELPRRERREFGATMMRQVRLGLAYVWQHRPTLWLLVLVAINMGIGMQYSVLIPVFARDLLKVGPHGYGFLMAAQGLGAVISAIVMNSRSTAPKALRQNLV